MKYRSRVAAFSPSGALLRTIDAKDARQLIEAGAAVYSLRLDHVSAIQLADHQMLRIDGDRLWPGSYGIQRDRETVPGFVIFSHRRTLDKELAA